MNKYFYDYKMNDLPNDILDIICKDLIKKRRRYILGNYLGNIEKYI